MWVDAIVPAIFFGTILLCFVMCFYKEIIIFTLLSLLAVGLFGIFNHLLTSLMEKGRSEPKTIADYQNLARELEKMKGEGSLPKKGTPEWSELYYRCVGVDDKYLELGLKTRKMNNAVFLKSQT